MTMYNNAGALAFVRARKKMYWDLFQQNGYRATSYYLYKMFLVYLRAEDKMIGTHPHLFPKPRYGHEQ